MGISIKIISFKGVILGSITDIASSNVCAIPAILYVVNFVHSSGVPSEKLAATALQVLNENQLFHAYYIVTGSLCSILGGYIAARISKHDEILNAALASFLCVSAGMIAILSGVSPDPVWQKILFLFLSPALSAFGGKLRLREISKAKNVSL
jgi:hypothetical protein